MDLRQLDEDEEEEEEKRLQKKLTIEEMSPEQLELKLNMNNNVNYGIGNCQPKSLQFLANRKAFLIIFCLTCVLQGTFHTYFVAVITTLEKLFNIPSQTIGTLMMASEIGQVSSALLLPYYAGGGHRPRWMGFGSALFSFATLLCASPHLIIPPNLNVITTTSNQFCDNEIYNQNNNNTTSCYSDEDNIAMDTESSNKYYLFAIIFTSLLTIGFGQTAIFTLGIPYLDDNVANRDSPLYFSITIGVRILGPVSGFILGSLCTRLYIFPLSAPLDFGPSDPRWLGAWWLGMLLISFLLLITSFFMFAFPKRLKKPEPKPQLIVDSETIETRLSESVAKINKVVNLRNFPRALSRLLSNKILVLRTFSSVFHLLPISGLYTFLPKYLESQFRLAAFEANMVAGLSGILVMGIGIFASGLFIRRKEPSPKIVALWVAISALIYSFGMVALMFIGCDSSNDFQQLDYTGEKHSFGKPSCDTEFCSSCSSKIYAPVCGADEIIYFSACHAGCPTPINNTDNEVYGNCSCVGLGVEVVVDKSVTVGLCVLDCVKFPLYLTIFMFIVLVHSTCEVGSMLLTLRCVEPRDKAMALGLIQCAIGLFGNVPCPVIYGAVVDRACVIWGGQSDCLDDKGHCWVYDSYLFRFYFHGLTALLMFTAFVIDMFIYFSARDINFMEEEQQQQHIAITTITNNKNCDDDNEDHVIAPLVTN